MFDKLIESNTAEAEFKPRRKFFMVSSFVVGIMFLSAVVFSLYAQDIDLGTDNFELAELLAPVAADAPEPERPRQQPQRTQQENHQTSELPNRPVLIARMDQNTKPPSEISTTPNQYESIPVGRFTNNPHAAESNGSGTPGPTNNVPGTGAGEVEPDNTEIVKANVPPPVAAPPAPKKAVTQSKGVVNGIAIALPKPAFPAVAKAMNLSAVVNVQVLISESGDVMSAKALEGHPLFKLEAERAAKQARFRPTLLSGEPVKVTGVIVYRFTK